MMKNLEEVFLYSYTSILVKDLFEWQTSHLTAHPLFRRLSEEEKFDDPVVPRLFESSEEGQKVSRNSGQKWCAVYERVPDPAET